MEEHAVGWLVFWNSAEYARTRDVRDSLVGSGPYLVDRHDGSIHHIPAITWMAENREELYLQRIKGIRPPDPLASSVGALMRSAGVVAAMSYLRKQAPRLSLRDARAYRSGSVAVRPSRPVERRAATRFEHPPNQDDLRLRKSCQSHVPAYADTRCRSGAPEAAGAVVARQM